MQDLTLERRDQPDETPRLVAHDGVMVGMMTPPLGEDYWKYRVKLSDTQAVVGFPKFGTIGIGFAVEGEDENVNLPYTCRTAEIALHILVNKGDGIAEIDVLRAVAMIQEAVEADGGPEAS